jgi:prepilin-type N-terminal cleavage/methylation domain-containing protein
MKGFTLLELMLAIILLGIVIYAASTAELAGRQFFNVDLAKSVLIREASSAVYEIAKMIRMGHNITISGGSNISIDIPDPENPGRVVNYYLQDGKLMANNAYLGVLVGEEDFVFQGSMIGSPDIEVTEFSVSTTGNLYTVTLSVENPKRNVGITLTTSVTPQN